MKIELKLDKEIISRVKRSITCHRGLTGCLEKDAGFDEYVKMLIEDDLEYIESNFVENVHTNQISERDKLHEDTILRIAQQLGVEYENEHPSPEIEIRIRKQALVEMEKEGWKLLADVPPR